MKHLSVSQLYLILCFITCTILGSYTRLAITKLSDYGQAFIQPSTVLWSNCVASLSMGLIQGLNEYEIFSQTMFVSLTTGYSGTVSSFSSFIMEMFLHSANLTETALKGEKFPNRAYGIMEFLSVLIIHLFVSMTSLLFGMRVAREFDAVLGIKDKETQPCNERVRKFMYGLQVISISLSIPLVVVHVVLASVYDNYSREWTLSAIFGMVGSLLRYLLARLYNSKNKNFPWGTFLANFVATLMFAVLVIVQRGKKNSKSMIVTSANTSRILVALTNGFCGGLSTISTFIYEGYKLPFRHTMKYYTITIASCYIICVVVLGSYAWTRGLGVALYT